MAQRWIELVRGSLEQKNQYKQYRARVDALPGPYRGAAKALWRYFMYYPGITDEDDTLSMCSDFADLWEQAAADRTPVRNMVGEDPITFAETFADSYARSRWFDKERVRLSRAIDDAEREQQK